MHILHICTLGPCRASDFIRSTPLLAGPSLNRVYVSIAITSPVSVPLLLLCISWAPVPRMCDKKDSINLRIKCGSIYVHVFLLVHIMITRKDCIPLGLAARI